MNKSMKLIVVGLFLVIAGFFGAREGDQIPVEYLDMLGMEPSYSCENPQIKANITPNGKIYHVPGGVYYDRTDLDPTNGERLFCTEEEAQDAGWRKSVR